MLHLASVFLVVATLDPSKGSKGLATFIVEKMTVQVLP